MRRDQHCLHRIAHHCVVTLVVAGVNVHSKPRCSVRNGLNSEGFFIFLHILCSHKCSAAYSPFSHVWTSEKHATLGTQKCDACLHNHLFGNCLM